MICLCCGKPIKNKEAASCGWHHSCIKHFFGTTRLPEITISNEALEWIANETISKGYTVPGVQKKLSLHLSKEEKARLTFVGYPSGYILKPQTNEYRALPEAEQMIMCMADAAGITTVPHGLIQPFEFHQERCRCFFGNQPFFQICVQLFVIQQFLILQFLEVYRNNLRICNAILLEPSLILRQQCGFSAAVNAGHGLDNLFVLPANQLVKILFSLYH